MLFECRSSGLSLPSKTKGDREKLLADSQRIFIETAKRLPKKISDLKTGITGVDVEGVTEFLSIILTYESAYNEPLLRQLAIQELDQEAARYLFIDIHDLETLVSWQEKVPARLLLKQWRDGYDANPRPFEVFLQEWAHQNGLDFKCPLLGQRRDSFFRSMTGQ